MDDVSDSIYTPHPPHRVLLIYTLSHKIQYAVEYLCPWGAAASKFDDNHRRVQCLVNKRICFSDLLKLRHKRMSSMSCINVPQTDSIVFLWFVPHYYSTHSGTMVQVRILECILQSRLMDVTFSGRVMLFWYLYLDTWSWSGRKPVSCVQQQQC